MLNNLYSLDFIYYHLHTFYGTFYIHIPITYHFLYQDCSVESFELIRKRPCMNVFSC